MTVGLARMLRVGEGDTFAELPILKGRRPASASSLSLPLAPKSASTKVLVLSCRPVKFLTISPVPTPRLPFGFGETARGAELFVGLAFAICSKWDRREETGFYIVKSVNARHDLPAQTILLTSHQGSLPQVPPSPTLAKERIKSRSISCPFGGRFRNHRRACVPGSRFEGVAVEVTWRGSYARHIRRWSLNLYR